MFLNKVILAATIAALPATAAFAQQTTYKQRHSIQARQNRQQARIAHGVQDEQITPKCAAAAEHRQGKIASEENSMRQSDNGDLTAQDRHTLARQQDRTSQNIYNRNHNAATDPGVTPK